MGSSNMNSGSPDSRLSLHVLPEGDQVVDRVLVFERRRQDEEYFWEFRVLNKKAKLTRALRLGDGEIDAPLPDSVASSVTEAGYDILTRETV